VPLALSFGTSSIAGPKLSNEEFVDRQMTRPMKQTQVLLSIQYFGVSTRLMRG